MISKIIKDCGHEFVVIAFIITQLAIIAVYLNQGKILNNQKTILEWQETYDER